MKPSVHRLASVLAAALLAGQGAADLGLKQGGRAVQSAETTSSQALATAAQWGGSQPLPGRRARGVQAAWTEFSPRFTEMTHAVTQGMPPDIAAFLDSQPLKPSGSREVDPYRASADLAVRALLRLGLYSNLPSRSVRSMLEDLQVLFAFSGKFRGARIDRLSNEGMEALRSAFGPALDAFWDRLMDIGVRSGAHVGFVFEALANLYGVWDPGEGDFSDFLAQFLRGSRSEDDILFALQGLDDKREALGEEWIAYWPQLKTYLASALAAAEAPVSYELQRLGNSRDDIIRNLQSQPRHSSEPQKLPPLEQLEWLALESPDLFTPTYLNRLRSVYAYQLASLRYVFYFLALQNRISWQEVEPFFPAHRRIHELLSGKGAGAVIRHETREGIGDELIRNGKLIQALRVHHRSLAVQIFSSNNFLYGYRPLDLLFEGNYTLTYLQTGDKTGPSLHSQSPIFLRSAGSYNDKTIHGVRLPGQSTALSISSRYSQYFPTLRLLAELGLRFPIGRLADEAERQALLEDPPADREEADQWWSGHVSSKLKPDQPVIYVNPWGGEHEGKGYTREAWPRLRRELEKLAKAGFLILLHPIGDELFQNGTALRNEFLAGLSGELRTSIVELPAARPRSALHKRLLARVDLVAAVEGLIPHLAHHLGKPYLCFGFYDLHDGDDSPTTSLSDWVPPGRSPFERYYPSFWNFAEEVIRLWSEYRRSQEDSLPSSNPARPAAPTSSRDVDAAT